MFFHSSDVLLYRNVSLWTPLDCAAAKGWMKTAKVLLEGDSPIDPMDKAKVSNPITILTYEKIILKACFSSLIVPKSERLFLGPNCT